MNKNNSITISVVIPNYNGMNYLDNCFNSLEKVDSNELEIIIIDNGSKDESLNFLKNKFNNNNKSNIKYKIILNRENLGFAAAVNQGIRESTNDYVFLLNNDTEIENDAIINLVNEIKNNEKVFSVSAKMIQYNNRDLIDDAGDEYTLLGWTKKSGDGKPLNHYSKKREIFSGCAGATLYRKSILDKIGYFDENFFAYIEDVDIGYRSQINGFKNLYCPNAIVYHVGSGSSGSRYNEFKIKLSARNNIWLVYKNMPWPQILVNIGFLFIGFLIKYLFFLKKGYGSLYLEGLKEGFKNRKKIEKTKFRTSNLKNYLKIEWKLILNTVKLLVK